MGITPADRALLQRCLDQEPGAWSDFVDRFVGLIYHVVQATAQQRGLTLAADDVEDVVAEVLAQLVARAYLTVIARRACLHQLDERAGGRTSHANGSHRLEELEDDHPPETEGLSRLEEVQHLLQSLPPRERRVVSLFYLEGRTYEEISEELGIPINSVGPILARARKQLRTSSS